MARPLAFASALFAGVLSVGSAWAEPSEADRATAREMANEGYRALQAKDYATAADRFARADALVHAPTLMIDWARSLAGLGKLVEAQERYEQILREGVEPKAPRSWQRAFADAGIELAALKPRLAWITISVPNVGEPRVTMDGQAVPVAAIGVRRAANPGIRSIRVQAKGYLPQKKSLELKEGGEESATFELEPDPDAQVTAEVTPTEPAAPVVPKESKPILLYATVGLAGAGFVFGGVTGALALSKRAQLADACDDDGDCAPSQRSNVDTYHSLGTLSGIGFGVGLAAAGTSVALVLLGRRSPPAPATQSVAVRPYFTGTSVGATGSF